MGLAGAVAAPPQGPGCLRRTADCRPGRPVPIGCAVRTGCALLWMRVPPEGSRQKAHQDGQAGAQPAAPARGSNCAAAMWWGIFSHALTLGWAGCTLMLFKGQRDTQN